MQRKFCNYKKLKKGMSILFTLSEICQSCRDAQLESFVSSRLLLQQMEIVLPSILNITSYSDRCSTLNSKCYLNIISMKTVKNLGRVTHHYLTQITVNLTEMIMFGLRIVLKQIVYIESNFATLLVSNQNK